MRDYRKSRRAVSVMKKLRTSNRSATRNRLSFTSPTVSRCIRGVWLRRNCWNTALQKENAMKYCVKKTFKYTEYVEVEASSEARAKEIAIETDGERNEDDYLYDCEVIGTV